MTGVGGGAGNQQRGKDAKAAGGGEREAEEDGEKGIHHRRVRKSMIDDR